MNTSPNRDTSTNVDVSTIDTVIAEVRTELERAVALYPSMHSAHEGHSIIEEEYEELWEHVRFKPARRVISSMRGEAIQLAAMAIRFALDVCNEEVGRR